MQNLFFRLALLCASMLCASTSVYAAGYTPACPASIQVEQKAADHAEGWKNYDSSAKHPLVNVMFSDDEPAQRFTLAPSKELKQKGNDIAIWNFTPSEKGIWVSCIYNETKVTLAKKLPDSIRRCSVTYDKKFASPVAKSIDCE